ncbi:hypothetical protein [Sphaerimonospora mesophila]|uniref:hypothetical protein n=1 Tax=Sphaerimonospora mesophila TaxID=37483 RepID=UPI0006E2C1E4
MRRSVRNLLALTAVTAAVAVGVPAAASAAGASTTAGTTATASTTSFSPSDSDYRDWWGTYRSRNRLAAARGSIDVRYHDEESNRVRVTGKLWDLDHRTYRRGGKCAFVQFRTRGWDGHRWSADFKSYKQCGAGHAKSFGFWRHDVAKVQVRVCQIGLHSRFPSSCASWRELYNAYDEEYGYQA